MGLDDDARLQAVVALYENTPPTDLRFRIRIDTIGSIIPQKFHPEFGKESPYVFFGYSEDRGDYYDTDLTDEQALFVLGVVCNSFSHVLDIAKTGKQQGDKPPRIKGDSLYLTLTDEQFEKVVPGKFIYQKDVDKIRKKREAIIPQ